MDPRDKALMLYRFFYYRHSHPQKKWYEAWKVPKIFLLPKKWSSWHPTLTKLEIHGCGKFISSSKNHSGFPIGNSNCHPHVWRLVLLKLPEWWHPTPGTALRRRWRPTSQPAAWVICVGLWMVMTFGQSVWCHEVAAWVLYKNPNKLGGNATRFPSRLLRLLLIG